MKAKLPPHRDARVGLGGIIAAMPIPFALPANPLAGSRHGYGFVEDLDALSRHAFMSETVLATFAAAAAVFGVIFLFPLSGLQLFHHVIGALNVFVGTPIAVLLCWHFRRVRSRTRGAARILVIDLGETHVAEYHRNATGELLALNSTPMSQCTLARRRLIADRLFPGAWAVAWEYGQHIFVICASRRVEDVDTYAERLPQPLRALLKDSDVPIRGSMDFTVR